MSANRFRVAFSFAGEKRDYVARVADILAKRFGEEAVLYDKFHEAEFARRDLGIYLPDLYHMHSDLLVVVVCTAYAEKEWCGLEWVAIHARLKNHHDAQVMLTRFDRAEIRGIYDTAGFIELDEKSPDEAATLILERLALNEGQPKDHYTKPASASSTLFATATPNNLPRLQPFFGREKEHAAISEALDPESRTWGVLIDGPGGIGKTSLAIRVAYDYPSGQFHRIIFLSVKGGELDDDGVRRLGCFILPSLLELFNELARELGQPDITKAPENQRVRLLLDALRPTHTLLILDNLESLSKEDRDQLFTFVKRLPQGCKAILTSRRRIGSGSELLILEKLEQVAALEILADLSRRNPLLAKTGKAERIALYTHIGGNPLLLRWMASQLGRGSCRTLEDALLFLRSCPPDNDPLEFIFGDLVKEFTDDETKVVCALTYFTQPANTPHIAELSGLNQKPVETALRTLANRSIVLPNQEQTAFALVPMVADFLRRTRPEIVTATGERIEQNAYALIVENGYEKHDRFAVLEVAWPTVAPALPLFIIGPNPQLQTVCSALETFLEFTGRWDIWLSLEQHAEAKAVTAGDHYHAGWRARMAGWVPVLREEADTVLACSNRALAHWEAARAGAHERAAAISLRGHCYKLKADYPAAIAAYHEALDLERTSSPESIDVARYLAALADAAAQSDDLATAERDWREAFRVACAIGHPELMAGMRGNLAALALHREDWPQAESLARDALSMCEKIGRQELIASNCNRLALALIQQGQLATALPHAQRAVDIFIGLGLRAKEKDARDTLAACGTSLDTLM